MPKQDIIRFFRATAPGDVAVPDGTLAYGEPQVDQNGNLYIGVPDGGGTKTVKVGGTDAGLVGTPTDGTIGTGATDGEISGVTPADSVADGFDKVEAILEKLAPAKPPNLSARTISIAGTYTALEQVTGAARTGVIDNTTPTATVSGEFYDGANGDLTSAVNATLDGTINLTAADDSGTVGSLTITQDQDFHLGTPGSEGFWFSLLAQVQATSALSLGLNTYQLQHTITGNTPVLSFFVDDPVTPTITSPTSTPGGGAGFVSGVPTLQIGDLIATSFDVNSAVGQHYNDIRIGRISGPQITNLNAPLPGVAPASGAVVAISENVSVAGGYSEDVQLTYTGYNSKGGTASFVQATNARVDTVSNESIRLVSGQGQFPAKAAGPAGFGDAFVSSVSLNTAGNEELQLVNGAFEYPSGNFTSNLPVNGPDYTSVPAGSYNGNGGFIRWVTFNPGSITAASFVTVNVAGAVGFGATPVVAGLEMYVLVEGDTGWLDANVAYPGVGNPVSNGDPALVIASSTPTSRRVTFGATTRTGQVWVRVGFPSGSTKKIGNVSI